MTVGNFKDEITMGEISKDKNTIPIRLQPDSQGMGGGGGVRPGISHSSLCLRNVTLLKIK